MVLELASLLSSSSPCGNIWDNDISVCAAVSETIFLSLTHTRPFFPVPVGGPCKFIAPQFEKLSEEYTTVTFAKVDVDKADDVAAAEGVQAMPTFKFYKGGKLVNEILGADVKKLVELLKTHSS